MGYGEMKARIVEIDEIRKALDDKIRNMKAEIRALDRHDEDLFLESRNLFRRMKREFPDEVKKEYSTELFV